MPLYFIAFSRQGCEDALFCSEKFMFRTSKLDTGHSSTGLQKTISSLRADHEVVVSCPVLSAMPPSSEELLRRSTRRFYFAVQQTEPR